VILIDSHPRNDWLMRVVDKRLREELARLRVEINEDKSRTIDLTEGGSFAFLGFEYRRVLGHNQKWRPQFVPKMKKRTALFAKLREVFRQHVSQPVGEVIEEINPVLRGWMNYFRIGHSTRCFSKIRDWVEMKIRRHLMRSRLRKGKRWKRWSSEARTRESYSCPTGRITLDLKPTGERSAGNPHATFEVAGSGNRFTVPLVSPLPEETGSPR